MSWYSRPNSPWLDECTAESDTIQALRDSPRTYSEYSSNMVSPAQKRLVRKIKPPGGRSPGESSVLFLYGDERRAVRLFIEENEETIRSDLSGGSNVFAKFWDDYLYDLLIEEWQIGGFDR